MGLRQRTVRVNRINGAGGSADGPPHLPANAGCRNVDFVPYLGNHVHVEHHLHWQYVYRVPLLRLLLHTL